MALTLNYTIVRPGDKVAAARFYAVGNVVSPCFGDRLLPVERPDSFDQRFKGLAVWVGYRPSHDQ
jgi:hypothetical protein